MVTRTKKYQRRHKEDRVVVVDEPDRAFGFAEESEEEEEEEESEDGDGELISWSPERCGRSAAPKVKHWSEDARSPPCLHHEEEGVCRITRSTSNRTGKPQNVLSSPIPRSLPLARRTEACLALCPSPGAVVLYSLVSPGVSPQKRAGRKQLKASGSASPGERKQHRVVRQRKGPPRGSWRMPKDEAERTRQYFQEVDTFVLEEEEAGEEDGEEDEDEGDGSGEVETSEESGDRKRLSDGVRDGPESRERAHLRSQDAGYPVVEADDSLDWDRPGSSCGRPSDSGGGLEQEGDGEGELGLEIPRGRVRMVYQRRQTDQSAALLQEREGLGVARTGRGRRGQSTVDAQSRGLFDLESEDSRGFEVSENQEAHWHSGQAYPDSTQRLQPYAPCATPASSMPPPRRRPQATGADQTGQRGSHSKGSHLAQAGPPAFLADLTTPAVPRHTRGPTGALPNSRAGASGSGGFASHSGTGPRSSSSNTFSDSDPCNALANASGNQSVVRLQSIAKRFFVPHGAPSGALFPGTPLSRSDAKRGAGAGAGAPMPVPFRLRAARQSLPGGAHLRQGPGQRPGQGLFGGRRQSMAVGGGRPAAARGGAGAGTGAGDGTGAGAGVGMPLVHQPAGVGRLSSKWRRESLCVSLWQREPPLAHQRQRRPSAGVPNVSYEERGQRRASALGAPGVDNEEQRGAAEGSALEEDVLGDVSRQPVPGRPARVTRGQSQRGSLGAGAAGAGKENVDAGAKPKGRGRKPPKGRKSSAGIVVRHGNTAELQGETEAWGKGELEEVAEHSFSAAAAEVETVVEEEAEEGGEIEPESESGAAAERGLEGGAKAEEEEEGVEEEEVEVEDPAAYVESGDVEEVEALRRMLLMGGQRAPCSLEEAVSQFCNVEDITKLGEGSFAEAFGVVVGSHEDSLLEDGGASRAGGSVCFKVVPMGGTTPINGEEQKPIGELETEAAVNQALNRLRERRGREGSPEAHSTGFIELKGLRVCRGTYPQCLLDAWSAWDSQFCSENDDPSCLPETQLYAVFALEMGGMDLEKYPVASLDEVKAILFQVTLALAAAEETCQFEHRDLHWGNILVTPTAVEADFAAVGGREYSFRTKGLRVAVIDFTLSRLHTGDRVIYCDLSRDEEIFEGPKGDLQCDTYRMMKKLSKKKWSEWHPRTNVVWLAYLSEMLLTKDTLGLQAEEEKVLGGFKKRVMRASTVADIMGDELFEGLIV